MAARSARWRQTRSPIPMIVGTLLIGRPGRGESMNFWSVGEHNNPGV